MARIAVIAQAVIAADGSGHYTTEDLAVDEALDQAHRSAVIFLHNGQRPNTVRIDILQDEADEAVAKSDWAAVRDRSQNVLRLDPENNDALSDLAAAGRDPSNASPEARRRSPESPDVLIQGVLYRGKLDGRRHG